MADTSAPASANSRPVQVKLVLLGEAAVGKSSVVLRFVSDDFQENKEPTIGAAFLTQKCRLEDKVIKFEIWDTAGQERFHSLAPMYYRNAQASAVIYDVTRGSSFEKAKSWVKELQRQANPNIVIALVGNKIDLLGSPGSSDSGNGAGAAEQSAEEDSEADDATATPPEGAAAAEGSAASNKDDSDNAPGASGLRQVPKDEAQAYAEEAGLLFFEASAKTGEGVQEVFTEIAKKIPLDSILSGGRGGTTGRGAARAGAGAGSGAAGGQGGERVDLAAGDQGAKKDGCQC